MIDYSQVDFTTPFVIQGVEEASSLGYTLTAAGVPALGGRQTAGIYPADYPASVGGAGLFGGTYSVMLPPATVMALGADGILWDAGPGKQTSFQSLLSPPLPLLCTVAVSVPYTPNPATSALEVMETGQVFGPFAGGVTGPNLNGTYTVTAQLTALPLGLAAGTVQVQAGDVIAGVFVPAALNGVAVAPTAGVLSLTGGSALPDVLLTVGPVLTNLSPPSSLLRSASGGFVHVRLEAKNADGQALDLTGYPVQLAATAAAPLAADFQPGDWLSLLPPSPAAGVYARLAVVAGAFARGAYWLSVQIGGTLIRADGILVVG